MVDRELKHHLAAILAADAAGYSRLMGLDERGTIDAVNVCRDVFRTAIESNGGRVVDMAGDSVLAVFDTTIGAFTAALAAQERIVQFNAHLPADRRLLFRIGINLGDIHEQNDGTVYGDGVNVAARLQGLADAGGIVVSGKVRDELHGRLNRTFTDLGEHEVKNIPSPVHVWRLLQDQGTDAPATVLKSAGATDKPSVVVMPFDNLSNDEEQRFLADGITEDLTTALSRFRWLSVIARNSAFAYKGRTHDVRRLGRELGVRYAVEGSVRRAGDRIRVSIQLADTASGSQLFSQIYDRVVDNLFDLQDEITLTVAAAIEPELEAAERALALGKPPESLGAWENYQRGLWHLYQYSRDNNGKAQRFFTEAIGSDPRLARAHAALAYTHTLDFLFGRSSSREETLREAMGAARKAVFLDDRDALARSIMGRVYTAHGDFEAAIAEAQEGIRLNPSMGLGHYILGHAQYLAGRHGLAVEAFEAAIRLSPHDPFLSQFEAMLAGSQLALGRCDTAVIIARQAIRRPRVSIWAFLFLASALAHLGRIDEARQAIDGLLELKPDFTPADLDKFAPHADRAHVRYLVEGLRIAGLDRSDGAQADG